MWVAELSKKGFLWLALLCTLLQLGLNLPASLWIDQNVTSKENNSFALAYGQPADGQPAYGQPAITAADEYTLQDLAYKRELEEEQKEEEQKGEESEDENKEENQTESEAEAGVTILLPAKIRSDFPLLFTIFRCENTKIIPLAISAKAPIPKYILYQQFKYHLG